MQSLILPRDELRVDTRQKNHIRNYLDRSRPIAGVLLKLADLKRKYYTAVHRPTSPCSTYNCHGLTFAARRTQITQSAVVQQILTEDEYQEISDNQILAGDIVIYYDRLTNDAEHSGVVIEVDQFGPKILSKWGDMHEVIHRLSECEYDGGVTRFYRMVK
jgi:hypothetical protein